ncbi:MAG: hypothetical protein ACLFVX_05595 [Archaeoglobaceae archaeon]
MRLGFENPPSVGDMVSVRGVDYKLNSDIAFKWLSRIEKEYGRQTRKKVGYYLALGYAPKTAWEKTTYLLDL